MITFTCYGRAFPQGSKRHVGRGIMIESSKGLKPWRQEVANTAIALGASRFDRNTPLRISLWFYFEKPATARKTRKLPTVRPDLDKLTRGILDALTGILYLDDAQIVEIVAQKLYGSPERCQIELGET